MCLRTQGRAAIQPGEEDLCQRDTEGEEAEGFTGIKLPSRKS